MRIVVVGGAGFIGSAVSRFQVLEKGATVLALDKLTARASVAALAPIASSPRFQLRRADIQDRARVAALLEAFAPDAIVHAAAERGSQPHDSCPALPSNLIGTWSLLETTRAYWAALPEHRRKGFRFLALSETATGDPATAAIRETADHMVMSWQTGFGIPAIVSRAAATYGPRQFPHEPVPSALIAALDGTAPAVDPASDATPPRGWLHVDDHVAALSAMLEKGEPGRIYTVEGSRATPADVARRVARLVERHAPRGTGPRSNERVGTPSGFADVMKTAASTPSVAPSLSCEPLRRDTGWRAGHTLESGLSQTVRWYLDNQPWWRPLEAAQAGGNVHGLLRSA